MFLYIIRCMDRQVGWWVNEWMEEMKNEQGKGIIMDTCMIDHKENGAKKV